MVKAYILMHTHTEDNLVITVTKIKATETVHNMYEVS